MKTIKKIIKNRMICNFIIMLLFIIAGCHAYHLIKDHYKNNIFFKYIKNQSNNENYND